MDVTEEMIALAYRQSRSAHISNYLWMRGDMTNLPFHDESFNGSVTRYTFHHLENPLAALNEMARTTKKGGSIVILDATPISSKQDA